VSGLRSLHLMPPTTRPETAGGWGCGVSDEGEREAETETEAQGGMSCQTARSVIEAVVGSERISS